MSVKMCDKREQFRRFFAALFQPHELVEFRFIEIWTAQGKRRSRLAAPAAWIPAGQIGEDYDDLVRIAAAERANVYFGVCPRPNVGDATDETIQTVRCLWCDMDDVSAEDARRRWTEAAIPEPSIVVSSGRGIHAYWLLASDLTTTEERESFAHRLPDFYAAFGGDHVQNLSRVMRPPGTVNYKGVRSGDLPVPCSLVSCQPERTYSFTEFARWCKSDTAPETQPDHYSTKARDDGPSPCDVWTRHAGAALLAARLDLPTRDRSRRDFAIVCDMLRLGLCPEEIWAIVADKSKFETSGRPYFELTIANAGQVAHSGKRNLSRSAAPD